MRGHWVLLLLAAGCRRAPDEIAVPSFVLVVDGPVVAGQPARWSAELLSPEGQPLAVDVALLSDREPGLTHDATTLTPTVAGIHTVTAVGDVGGAAYEATAGLVVTAGAAAALDLVLEANQAVAGEPLGFSVIATDAFGNPLTGIDVAADSRNLSIVSPHVVSTVPGIYTLTANLPSLTDVEVLRVVPGKAVELVLSLSDSDLEVYETSTATARAYDVYGNAYDVDWDLSIEGGTTTTSGRNITFWTEGWFTVWARYQGLEDSVGPLLLDSMGPSIEIETPERGTFSTDASTTVSGTVSDAYTGVDGLTVNGAPVTVGGDGAFTTAVDKVFGLNILETEAVDGDGNRTTDTRAVLAGAFVPYGEGHDDGLAARINQGGFDALESLGEGLIAGTDLNGLLPSPAFSTSSESCIDVYFDEICITWYAVNLTISNVTLGANDLEIDPDAGGWLNTTFTVYDPSIDWGADGSVIGIDYSSGGQIYADSIAVDMDLQAYVLDHVLGVNVLYADVASAGFTFDWDTWIYDAMGFFGLDLSGLIQGYMEDAIEGAITDEVPSLVADAVGDLEIATELPVADNVYTFDAAPSSVTVDDLGLTLGLQTRFTAQEWRHPEEGPGSLFADYSLPLYRAGTPGMQLSLSLDFLNQALYAFWGGGVLEQTLGEEELGLDLGALSTFLPFEGLSIETNALLPPVLVPGTGGALLDLQLGDLALTLYDGPPETGAVVFQLYASIIAELDLDVSADGLLVPALGEVTIWFDVVTPASGSEASADAEALLGALVPMLLPSLTAGLGEVPIPSIEGFSLVVDSIALDGAESGYVSVNGDLSVE